MAQKASSEPLWQPLSSAHHLMLQSLRKQQRGDRDSESCADRKQKGKKLQSFLPVDSQSISVLAGHTAGPGGLWPHVGCFSEREGLPGPWCCRDWPLTLSHLSGHQGEGFPGSTIVLLQFLPQGDYSRVRIQPPAASPPSRCARNVLRGSSLGTFSLQKHCSLVAMPESGQQHTW